MRPPEPPARLYGGAVTARRSTSPTRRSSPIPYPAFAQLRATTRRCCGTSRPGSTSRSPTRTQRGAARPAARPAVAPTRSPTDRFEPFNHLHRHQMMETEPPDHTRLRSLVAKAFARGHVERLRPRVQQLADELLDAVAGRGEFDLHRGLRRAAAGGRHRRAARRARGRPAPAAAVVAGDREDVRVRPHRRASRRDGGRRGGEFADYMRDARRRAPRGARATTWSATWPRRGRGQTLTEDELVASAILLLNAGHEASVNAFGNGMVTLLRPPGRAGPAARRPGPGRHARSRR